MVKGEIFSVYVDKKLFKVLKEYCSDQKVRRSVVLKDALVCYLNKRGYVR